MARAFLKALKNDYNIFIATRSDTKNSNLISYQDLNINDKIIILAFKPHDLAHIASFFKNQKAKAIISILASTSLDDIKNHFNASNITLAMPNLASEFKASITPFISLNDEFKDEIKAILEHLGQIVELKNEKELKIASVLSGCTPAYLSLIADAFVMGGVLNGLSKNTALDLTRGLFASFATLLENNDPNNILYRVCSPGGISIKGIKELEEKAIKATIINALNSSLGSK